MKSVIQFRPARISLALAAVFCLLMLVFAAIGIVKSYDLTPFGDMWDGVVYFYLHANDWNHWFDQHGEHRIVLSRLLFWADMHWFGGRSILLLVCNYGLAGLLAASMCRIFLDVAANADGLRVTGGERVLFCLLLTGWVFQWSQYENFGWGFQSQFFLVQLLPLWGFYLIGRVARRPDERGAFAMACLSGFAAIGAMANGVLALPAMTAYAAIARMQLWRIAVLALLAALGLALFFHNYHAVFGSPLAVILHHPFGVAHFALLYLGNPWLHLFGNRDLGRHMALLFGLILVARSGQLAAAGMLAPRRDPMRLALVTFIGFICVSAISTAAGRLQFGLIQAFSSRYNTPAVMAWAVFAIIHTPLILAAARRRPWVARVILTLFCVALLGLQTRALNREKNVRFDRALAGLALELGVHDQAQVKTIFPAERVYDEAAQARQAHLTMFAAYPYDGDLDRLGAVAAAPPAAACQGALMSASTITGDDHFVSVSGWLASADGKGPTRITILDASRRVIGYALTGTHLPGRKSTTAYKGYVRADALSGALTLVGDHPDCALTVPAPAFSPLVSLHSAAPAVQPGLAGADAVQPGSIWSGGGDSQRSTLPGLKVFGSYVRGDSDTGAIRLHVNPGEALFYRSGPGAGAGHQVLTIAGAAPRSTILPVADDWAQLSFTPGAIPAGGAMVEIDDQGAGWGEWSAIAVRADR